MLTAIRDRLWCLIFIALCVSLVGYDHRELARRGGELDALGTFKTENLDVENNDVFGGSHFATVRVDLARAPYSLVPNDSTKAAANTAGFKQAITDWCGTHARLVIPPGIDYFDQDGGNRWSINIPSTCTDIAIVGYGMFATQLAQFGAGNSGEWDLVVNNGQRIEFAEFGMYQDTITNPDPIQENHLLAIYDSSADVYGHDLYFGKSIGDELRWFANAGTINNIHFTRVLMRGHGTVTSTPPNGRVGSRSGLAIQRGCDVCEFDHFDAKGAQNSELDEEPTGGASQYIHVHDGLFDNSQGSTSQLIGVGGESGGAIDQHQRIEHVLAIAGAATIIQTSDLQIDDLTMLSSAAFVANPTDATIAVRQSNADIQLRNLHLERTGTSGNGILLDLENSAGNTTITGGTFTQGTVAVPVFIDESNNTRLSDMHVQYNASSGAASEVGIEVFAVDGNTNNLQVSNVQVTCQTGKLQSGIYLAARAPRSMNNISVRGLHAAGAATNCFQTSLGAAATLDPTPILEGVECGSADTVWFAGDAGDNPVTTLYPLLGETTPTATPGISSCGGAGAAITGINEWGYVTEGAGGTGCTITFSKPFTNRPSCTLTSEDNLGFTFTVTNTALTITNVGALAGKIVDYHCRRV